MSMQALIGQLQTKSKTFQSLPEEEMQNIINDLNMVKEKIENRMVDDDLVTSLELIIEGVGEAQKSMETASKAGIELLELTYHEAVTSEEFEESWKNQDQEEFAANILRNCKHIMKLSNLVSLDGQSNKKKYFDKYIELYLKRVKTYLASADTEKSSCLEGKLKKTLKDLTEESDAKAPNMPSPSIKSTIFVRDCVRQIIQILEFGMSTS